jgi:hypothetical protein
VKRIAWGKPLGRLAGTLRRIGGRAATSVILRVLAFQSNGFVAAGDRWRAAWLGPEPTDRETMRRLIRGTYEGAVNFLRQDFQVSPPHRGIAVVCGGAQQIELTFRELVRVASRPVSHIGSCFWAPDIAIVARHPEDADFKAVVAHELTHAVGFLARRGIHAPPWIDEGVASLVAQEVAQESSAVYVLSSGCAHASNDFRLPISLQLLFQPTQALDDDIAQSMLTAEAGMFLQFLHQLRPANDASWNVARRAFAGLEPELTLPARCLERAFGASLDQIEREFAAFCRPLLDDSRASSDAWRRQLLGPSPRIN